MVKAQLVVKNTAHGVHSLWEVEPNHPSAETALRVLARFDRATSGSLLPGLKSAPTKCLKKWPSEISTFLFFELSEISTFEFNGSRFF